MHVFNAAVILLQHTEAMSQSPCFTWQILGDFKSLTAKGYVGKSLSECNLL